MALYVIEEKVLIDLLANSYRLEALESSGVDNWCGYGEGFQECRDTYGGKDCESFEDAARVQIKEKYRSLEI